MILIFNNHNRLRYAKVYKQSMECEWDEVRERLSHLSVDGIRWIATEVGITFTIGNHNITDKNELLLVLDEADREALTKAYRDILNRREDMPSGL